MSAECELQPAEGPRTTAGPDPHPAARAADAIPAQQLAVRGWTSWLAIAVAALAALQTITGLWIYLAPFSATTQFQVIAHTVGGVAFVVPFVWYVGRHFLVWYAQKVTAVMILGYLAAGLVAACTISGLWLTWQAAAGPRIGPTWDLVHLVSGLVTAVLIVTHLVLAFLRRRLAAREAFELRAAVRRFLVGCGSSCVALGALTAAVLAVWPRQPAETPVPEGYSLSAYLEQYDEYRGNPFAPSYARNDSGNLIDPAVLGNSASCGTAGCHEQVYAEWQPSAHRFSAMNPSFQAIQRNFAADRGAEETRYCAGCHDPISLMAGAKDIHNLSLSAPGMQEGCSCVVCHAIDTVDVRGNADYVLVPPRQYLWEHTDGWRKSVSNFLIRAFPRQHLADYDRGLLHSPEFCGACHKQFIPEALNRFGMVAGQNQYDEWHSSHWNTSDPETNLSCIDCHMRLVRDSHDPARGETGAIRRTPDDGMHRHHGFIATNFFMPQVLQLPHADEQVRLTEEWIRGETVIPEIAHLWPAGPVASLELLAPATAAPGDEVHIDAIVVNAKAGHNLTTGPLDFMRVWLHVRVLDAEGRTIAEWGGIDPVTREITDVPGRIHQIGNSRKEGTLVLEGLPINGQGQPILRHELWTQAGGKGKRVIFPGYSDRQTYTLRIPDNVQGPLVVKADLNFRRYRQEFLDLVLPTLERDTGVYQPLVPQSSAQHRITLVSTPAP